MANLRKIEQAIATPFDGYKCKNRTRLQDIRRNCVYDSIISRIGNNQFKWNNLPNDFLDHCNSQLMEMAINCGVAVLYKVPVAVSATNGGHWTVTPLEWTGAKRNDGTADHFITSGSDYSITDTQLDKYVM